MIEKIFPSGFMRISFRSRLPEEKANPEYQNRAPVDKTRDLIPSDEPLIAGEKGKGRGNGLHRHDRGQAEKQKPHH